MVTLDSYTFLSWYRQGISTAIKNSQLEGNRVTFSTKLTAKANKFKPGEDEEFPEGLTSIIENLKLIEEDDEKDFDKNIEIYGPGDVVGFDPTLVVRTDPLPNIGDFEPNYFPLIEFAEPDFPWRFTPQGVENSQRLQPWICLIVLRDDEIEKQEGLPVTIDTNLPLPFVTLKNNGSLPLPDLDQAWAWVHVQINKNIPVPQETMNEWIERIDQIWKTNPAQFEKQYGSYEKFKNEIIRRNSYGFIKPKIVDLRKSNPELFVSRLLCPRKLEPGIAYHAFVVPTFKSGVKAGLGEDISSNFGIETAWYWDDKKKSMILENNVIPAYYYWSFRTGNSGDFESLVRKLDGKEAPKKVGSRVLKVKDDSNLNVKGIPEDVEVRIEGALIPTGFESKPEKICGNYPEFQKGLARLLNMSSKLMKEGKDPENEEDHVVVPPIYGNWHKGTDSVDVNNKNEDWLNQLNLDPRNRAVAAFGTSVVQEHQEDLMAAAWEQAGHIEEANQVLRNVQLARVVSTKIKKKHFENLSEDAFLSVTSKVHSKILAPNKKKTIKHEIDQSRISASVVSAGFRKVSRAGGPLKRSNKLSRFQRTEELNIEGGGFANRLNNDKLQFETEILANNDLGMITYEGLGKMGMNEFNKDYIKDAALPAGINPFIYIQIFRDVGFSPRDAMLNPQIIFSHYQGVKQAIEDVTPHIVSEMPPAPVAQKMDLTKTNSKINLAIEPKTSLINYLKNRIYKGRISEDMKPIGYTPEFDKPMYEHLVQLSQDYFLPGLEFITDNTATLLETNQKFIEAFMIGLNHEMGREFRWREYQADFRATYFKKFWDTDAAIVDAKIDLSDIKDIIDWTKDDEDSDLGSHLPDKHLNNTGNFLVLLIRGELLKKYPDTLIYAVKAICKEENKKTLGTNLSFPVFRGIIPPDITFLGFSVPTVEEAKGDPDWFFMIQQQPTQPRFGLDEPKKNNGDITPLETWKNLSWSNLERWGNSVFSTTNYIDIVKDAPNTIQNINPKWGQESALQANIHYQLPVRIAIHASEMLPEQE